MRSVVGGHTGVLIAPVSDAAPFVAAGRLRPLAVTSPQRIELMKEVPTLAESGFPGFQAVQWLGAVAPAGTPKSVIARLSAEVLRALENPEVRSDLRPGGCPAGPDGRGAVHRLRAQRDDHLPGDHSRCQPQGAVMQFAEPITSEEQLRAVTGWPAPRALKKEITTLDVHCRAIIAKSPFVLISSCDAEGRMDVSPKGDPPGFVQVAR